MTAAAEFPVARLFFKNGDYFDYDMKTLGYRHVVKVSLETIVTPTNANDALHGIACSTYHYCTSNVLSVEDMR